MYHSAVMFVTGCIALTHHCTLYARVLWPSLALCRLTHWYIFIYKSILGLLPSYLCGYISLKTSNYCLCSNDTLLLSAPTVCTEFGNKAFMFFAPAAWNHLRTDLQLDELIPIRAFKNVVKGLEANSTGICNCFLS